MASLRFLLASSLAAWRHWLGRSTRVFHQHTEALAFERELRVKKLSGRHGYPRL